jgi:hypothetical protein
VTAEDPATITQTLDEQEDYMTYITEETKTLQERWAKIVQMAQEDMLRVVQSPDCSIRDLEAAMKKYFDYPVDTHQVYRALKEKYNAFVRQGEERLASLLTSFSVQHIDAALAEYRDSCDALIPMVEKLTKHRLEACLSMSTKMQTAARGTDAVTIAQILDEAKEYGAELQLEAEALRDRFEWLVGDAKTELIELLKTDNMASIIRCLAKYETFPPAIEQTYEKLLQHKELLLATTKQRLGDLCGSDDPQEIRLQLDMTDDYAEVVHQERARLKTRLADLVKQARAQMRNIIANPAAPLGDVEEAMAKYLSYPDDVQTVRASLLAKRDAMVEAAAEELASLTHSHDVTAVNSALEAYTDSSDLLKSSVQVLQKYRDTMGRAVSKQMRAAAAKADLPAMQGLLEAAALHIGDEIERETIALRQRCPRPPGAVKRPSCLLAFSYENSFCMGLLYGRAGR